MGRGKFHIQRSINFLRMGAPASTPSLREMLKIWQAITTAANPWLETLTSEKLQEFVVKTDGTKLQRTYGSLLQRMIYHYWYHTGGKPGNTAQMLGHTHLPQFVGNIDRQAPYTPE